MKSAPTAGHVFPALRALALAATLACGANVVAAADASLSITSFTATTDPFSGASVWTLDRYQSYTMGALNGGGLHGEDSDSYSADNWDMGINRVAQTSNAMATGNTIQFTDVETQLTTAGFYLGATAQHGSYPVGTPPTQANANAVQSGAFTLIDENGDAMAGTITFDVYYDLSTSTPLGNAPLTFAQAVVSLLVSSDGGGSESFDDGLVSTDLVGGAGSKPGQFTWSVTLGAGESAYYTLAGGAYSAALVPEPGTYALFGAGLFAVAALARRRRRDA